MTRWMHLDIDIALRDVNTWLTWVNLDQPRVNLGQRPSWVLGWDHGQSERK
jgi:hypothetical protein